jgi:hypothetical protein
VNSSGHGGLLRPTPEARIPVNPCASRYACTARARRRDMVRLYDAEPIRSVCPITCVIVRPLSLICCIRMFR